MAVTSEQVLDRIAELLVENFQTVSEQLGLSKIEEIQKSVDDVTGQVVVGRPDGKKVVLYQYDKKANVEDLQTQGLQSILAQDGTQENNTNITIEQLNDANITFNTPFSGAPSDVVLTINAMDYNIGDLMDLDNNNPINLSQFIDFEDELQTIDPEKASQFLDTNIFELISPPPSNQERIDNFFREWSELKGTIPEFDLDINNDGTPDTWDEDIETNQDEHSNVNDIVNDPLGNITRLDKHANEVNSGKTLESLHRELGLFLSDVTNPLKGLAQDERPNYNKVSDGFLKIRHLNQGIMIRKQEGLDVGIEKLYDVPFDSLHPHSDTADIPSYLGRGFTITTWVRFLDKTSEGTLFNYGNPTRNIDPKGFKLETYVLDGDDKPSTGAGQTWKQIAAATADETFFQNSNQERFVRLVVRDHLDTDFNEQGNLYDSHLGLFSKSREIPFVPELGSSGFEPYDMGDEKWLITNTRIPVNFEEWYFIVATYNPRIDDSSNTNFNEDSMYWLGNINPNVEGNLNKTHRSGYGAKCKIEIISQSELLRARGYKT